MQTILSTNKEQQNHAITKIKMSVHNACSRLGRPSGTRSVGKAGLFPEFSPAKYAVAKAAA
jgi:hypothetical protein